MTKLTPEICQQAIDYYAAYKGDAAEKLNIGRDKLFRRRKKAAEYGLIPKKFGTLTGRGVTDRDLPPKGKIKRYLCTSAQSNTKVNSKFWRNLLAMAEYYDAEILVGRMRYNHSARLVAQEKDNGVADDGVWYAPEILPYVCDERLRLCEGLLWVGDMNCMPTAVNPLSGLESFGGEESCIFPHTKIAKRSVATHPSKDAKKLYTTGAVTQLNYIGRKAGLKAEFHHAFAATLVEIDHKGVWFPRQINADKTGKIYDIDICVKGGKVTKGSYVDVFIPGDIHARYIDPVIMEAVWGKDGLVDTLKPKAQVLHDLLDFDSQSHHNTIFDKFEKMCKDADSVEGEIQETFDVLKQMERDNIKTYIVSANHNDHLTRWLMDCNPKADLKNAIFYHKAMGEMLTAIRDETTDFNILEWAFRQIGKTKVNFLGRLDSLVIKGIRLDQHFDIGSNGSRGSAQQYAKMGEKATGGHSHSDGIFDGAYQVGTFSKLLLNYVQGMSSWSASCCLQYENGKRTLSEFKDGKWCHAR